MAKSENLLLSTVWGLRIEPVLISIMMIVTKLITKVIMMKIIQPTGLRAESARAVTGRQCPHSGVGEDFLVRRPFFCENRRNSKTKVQKLIPRCKMDRLSEGYKRAVNQIGGCIAKNKFLGRRKYSHFSCNHVLAMTGKSCAIKKPFHYQSFCKFGVISKKRKKKRIFV